MIKHPKYKDTNRYILLGDVVWAPFGGPNNEATEGVVVEVRQVDGNPWVFIWHERCTFSSSSIVYELDDESRLTFLRRP